VFWGCANSFSWISSFKQIQGLLFPNYLVKKKQFDAHIFQMGWFSHQLEDHSQDSSSKKG